MKWKNQILLVEDDDASAELVREYLEGQTSHYFVLTRCATLAAAMAMASQMEKACIFSKSDRPAQAGTSRRGHQLSGKNFM